MTQEPSSRRGGQHPGATWYAVCGILVVLFIAHCAVVNYTSDDAFISFRYVKNLLQGHGLVFNVDERVEGYTNFLWVMLLAGVQLLLPGVYLLDIAKVLGVLFGALTIGMVLQFSWQYEKPFWPFGWLGATLLAAHAGFAAWSTGGLESSLFAFLLFAGAWAHVHYVSQGKRWWLAPLLFALATMTRPDGILFFGMTFVHLLFVERRRTGKWWTSRWIAWAAVFAAVFGPYFAWRYNYYGYLFPNTFYAKTSGITFDTYWRGSRYIRNYFRVYGLFLPLLVVASLARRKLQPWVSYYLVLVAGYFAYIVYVGGDGLTFHRFVSYLAPFLCVLTQTGVVELHRFFRARVPRPGHTLITGAAYLVILVTLVYSLRPGLMAVVSPSRMRWHEPQSELSFPGDGNPHSYLWFDNYFVDRLAVAARWLEANAPPDSLVAATPAGSISYHMNHRVIDMLGLNDAHIARSEGTFVAPGTGRAGHEKGDGKYVLSRSPDYILMGNVAVLPFPMDEQRMAKKLVLKSEHEIWQEPSFHRDYELVTIHLADQGVFQYFSFYRKKTISPRPTETGAKRP